MRQTIEGFRRLANRFKLPAALLSLFMSGALISITLCAWYYDRVISAVHGSYGGRIRAYNADIRRLQREVDAERTVTRLQLQAQAEDIDKMADDVGRLTVMLEQAAETAQKAASTANSAATTAKGAAKNAAQAGIRKREVPSTWVRGSK